MRHVQPPGRDATLPTLAQPVQPSFDDLSTPLIDVTFAVLDLETTGLSPTDDRITEVGVVKSRAGEVLGEFSTLVNPGRAVPSAVSAVTGITDHMVSARPPIEAVLPALVEFLRGTVLVAHNATFDTRFLAATLERHAYPPLALPVLDTAAIARRVLRDEVRNCRLATLAAHVRSRTVPEHRALPDARATLDVLHHLLERAGSLGATTLEELQAYATSTSDRAYRKIDLVRDAPAAPGVYRFLDERDEVLYVGTTHDLRTRLRRYFGGDRRRRVADLVRETVRVEWTTTPTRLEAGVRELREIRAHRPRYNRRSKLPERQVHLKLTAEPFPRLSVVSTVREDRATYLTSVGTRRTAGRLLEALHEASSLRQCTTRLRVAQDHPTCVLKELGRCASPCDGTTSREGYAEVAGEVAGWLTDDPSELLDRLRRRMRQLAAAGRYEDAAVARGRLHLAARTLARSRRLAWVAAVDELVVVRPGPDGEAVRAVRGRVTATLVRAAAWDEATVVDRLRAASAGVTVVEGPPGPAEVEEVELLLGWLDAGVTRPLVVTGRAAQPVAGGRHLDRALAESRRLGRQLRRDRLLLDGARVAAVG
jgi:DNA polymerase-3 subunit epsilon